MSNQIVNVEVVVYENGQEVGRISPGYFKTQPYTVQIVTPDGIDGQVARKAGLDEALRPGRTA